MHPVSLGPSYRRGNGGPGESCAPHDVTRPLPSRASLQACCLGLLSLEAGARWSSPVFEDLQRAEFEHLSPVRLVLELPQPWGRVTVLLVCPTLL